MRGMEIFREETERRLQQMERVQLLSEERERIARELHDGVIQCLYGAGLQLETLLEQPSLREDAIKMVRGVMDTLDQAIADLRNYIYDLRVISEGQVLERELRRLLRQPEFRNGPAITFQVGGMRRPLSPEQVHHLVQIARETLANAIRHADASTISLKVHYGCDAVTMTVQDDGQGIPPGDEIWRKGQGLSNIKRRVEILNGKFVLKSQPGQGTIVRVVLPYLKGRSDETAEDNARR